MTKELAREWIDKADAMGERKLHDHELVQWTTNTKGYANIMSALTNLDFKPETRQKRPLDILLDKSFDHVRFIRNGKTRTMVTHNYPSTILSTDSFRQQLLKNLDTSYYALSAYVLMTPIAPYALNGSGMVGVVIDESNMQVTTRFMKRAIDVDFEEAADIFAHSQVVMAAIAMSGQHKNLTHEIAMAFHKAAVDKWGFRDTTMGLYEWL